MHHAKVLKPMSTPGKREKRVMRAKPRERSIGHAAFVHASFRVMGRRSSVFTKRAFPARCVTNPLSSPECVAADRAALA